MGRVWRSVFVVVAAGVLLALPASAQASGLCARREAPGRSRAADLQDRAAHDHARPEQDRLHSRSPRGLRSTVASPASSPTSSTRTARCQGGHPPPPPRRLGEPRSADATSPSCRERFFAAGEEKTIIKLPKRYGYHYKVLSDRWLLNHMIHNLIAAADAAVHRPTRSTSSPTVAAAREIRAGPADLDGRRERLAAIRSSTSQGQRQARRVHLSRATGKATPTGNGARKNEWTVDRDGVLVSTAGHLHPGGLYTDLWVRRRGEQAGRARSAPSAAERRASAAARRPDGRAATRRTCSSPGPSTSSRRARCPGTSR